MKFIYICVVFAVIMGVAQVQCGAKEDMHEVAQACLAESHATEGELKKFFEGGMNDADATDPVKCQIKCIMEKQGHFKNGALDEEAGKKFLQSIPALKDHQDLINKSVDDCKTKKGANDCETAFMITKCMSDHKTLN